MIYPRIKRKIMSAAAVTLAVGMTVLSGPAVTFAATGNSASWIGVDQAKSIALNNAGLRESDVTFLKAKLDHDDGRYEYDIEFYSANAEYDYEIDAVTGAILEYDYDVEHHTIPGQTANNNQGNNSYIGDARAKSIALSNAGLRESDVVFIKVKLDYDDGRDVYEVEFYNGNTEYDYEIDAVSGDILEQDRDIEDYMPNYGQNNQTGTSSNSGQIGETRAKSIALNHAGLTESGVGYVKVKLDYDDGRSVYEVEFQNGRMEYDYEIDAASGTILEWDADYDD